MNLIICLKCRLLYPIVFLVGTLLTNYPVPDAHAAAAPDVSTMCLLGTGNFGLDVTVCSSAIHANKDDIITLGALHLARGRARRLRGDCELAIEDFTQAEVLMPFSAAAAARRGVARRCLGQFSMALREFDRSLDLNPFFSGAWRDRGITRFFDGEVGDALNDLRRAVEIDAQDAEAHTFIALCHLVRNELDLAQQYFDRGYDLGHAWQYLPLWQLLIRQQRGSLEESFRSKMLDRSRDRQWPAPLYARYLDVKVTDSIVDPLNSEPIKIYDNRRQIEDEFYRALHDAIQRNGSYDAIMRLQKLSRIEINPPSAEVSLARMLSTNKRTFFENRQE